MLLPEHIETAKGVFRDLGIDDAPEKPVPDARSGKRSRPDVKPFPFVLARDIVIEPKEYLIDGFLGLQEQSGFFGQPDSGKSAIVIHAACCVAAGEPFCGRTVRQGAVLYVAAERGAVVRRRVLAWCMDHDIKPPIAVIDEPIDFRTGEMDAARIIATANSLSMVCGAPVVWVIFDTLARIMAGGDESSSKDMGALIGNMDKVHRATGAHCTVIHHVPVASTDRMRGHGSLPAALDTTAGVSKSNGIVTVKVEMANDLVDKPVFAFTFKSVQIVDTTTAPVAIERDVTSAAKAMPAKMPKAARMALDALGEAIVDCGQAAPASNYVPPGVRTVTMDQWRDLSYRRGISASNTTDRAKQKAFKGATEYLIANKYVGFWQETVWLGRTAS
jgi:hypothetical protein